MKFGGKVAVVTGGGSGIGRALVLELLSRGASVAAVDVREEGLGELAAEVGDAERLSVHVADCTDRTAVEALPAAVSSHHGAIDVVIHNAGIIQPFKRLAELDYEDIDRVLDVNLYGAIYVTKTFLPHLVERPEAHIANVASMGAFLPVPAQSIYGASKAAVKLMTESLYAELLETDVGVSVVMPGSVSTNIAENSGIDIKGMEGEEAKYNPLSAAEAATIILDGIEDDELHILVGSDARLMSIANRVAPEAAIRLIQRRMKSLLEY